MATILLIIHLMVAVALVVLVLLSYIFGRSLYLDVALVYGLLNFLVTVVAARFMETGRLSGEAT